MLHGIPISIGKSNPLTIITGDRGFEIETTFSLDGASAGLVYMYDAEIFNALCFTGTELILYRIGRILARIPYIANQCTMKMRVDGGYLSFWYWNDQGKFQKLNYVIDTSAQNTLAYGGFLSLRPGVFSIETGTALFSNFRYTGLS